MSNWQKSIRELTTEQTSDGTTIDGNRLERMLTDTLRRFNALRRGDRVRAWVPNTYVGGYSPNMGTVAAPGGCSQSLPPWIPIFHDKSASSVVGATPTGLPSNPFRNKGQRNLNVDPMNNPTSQSQLAWTTAFYFRRPVIVTAYSLTMLVPDFAAYSGNTFAYVTAAHPLPWPQGNAPSDDLFVQLAVDNPFSQEARLLANTELTRYGFKLDSQRYSGDPATIAATPLVPAFAPNATYGVNDRLRIGICVEADNLNIPLPANSRARLCFAIPRYPTTFNTGWTPVVDETHPQGRQSYSWTLTVLEPVL